MSTIKSSDEHLTLNADGSSKDIKFQANGVEKASISSAGAFTSTTIDATKLTGNLPAISAASLTNIPAANITGTLPAIDGSNLTGVGVSGITSSADATAMTITSDEKVLVNETVSGHADAGTTVITNKALGKAALTLKSLQSHAAGVGTEIVALNFAAHNYYSASNPGIYGQISCENGNGSYSDRGQLVLSTGYGGNQITERLVLTSDGRGKSQFTAHAWGKVSCQGTPSLITGHNVSSITDVSTGRYRANYTNSSSGANSVTISGQNNNYYDEIYYVDVDDSTGTRASFGCSRSGAGAGWFDTYKMTFVTFAT